MLQFSTSSRHARFYVLMYGDYGFPNSLCPYFWKLVLALVLSVIVIPFHAVQSIVFYISKKVRKDDELTCFEHGLLDKASLVVSTLLNVAAFLLFCGIGRFFSKKEWITTTGLVFYLTVGAVLLSIAIESYNNYKSKKVLRSAVKEKKKKNYVVREFIKATYKRYCPIITWNYED